MKVPNRFSQLEKAQFLPIVVIGVIVMIAFAALIIDGGAIMLNRRTAQTAADAGALAGALRVCLGESDAKAVAEAYATLNNAPSPTVTVSGKQVTVVASVEHPSFFAKIFGEDSLKADAEAVANCYYPDKAKKVLPIAFFYKSPPINAKNAVCNTNGSCNLVSQDFKQLMDALRDTQVTTGTKINLPLDDIYIISDKTKICEKNVSGAIVCSEMLGDINGGGNRSFLDLNETLKKIIEDGLTTTLDLPTWVNAQPGADTSVYNPSNYITNYPPIVGYESVTARLYFLPVFDKFCGDCSCAPTGDYDPVYCDQYNFRSYHLVGFAPFVVTCVQKGPDCAYGGCVKGKNLYQLNDNLVKVEKDICPGLLASDHLLASGSNIPSAIEGYFIESFPTDQYIWGTDGVDVGIHFISLSK